MLWRLLRLYLRAELPEWPATTSASTHRNALKRFPTSLRRELEETVRATAGNRGLETEPGHQLRRPRGTGRRGESSHRRFRRRDIVIDEEAIRARLYTAGRRSDF